MKKIEVTRDDILAAIDAVAGTPPNDAGITLYEYMAAHGCTLDRARNFLDKQVRLGTLIKGKAYRTRPNGSQYPMAVYRPR